ncbi:DUF5682 family protein [Pseudomonas sp. F1_0610]|uniref:DUF5682 family protein n=1 Tax=Pseudomonas sp. F1_0610 TaxID=3114284 RepID=UPI0039C3F4BC
MSTPILEQLPDRLAQALNSIEALAQAHIYFAPVRHHSPACAFAVRNQIEQLKPTHILIEAPNSFNSLIPDLLSEESSPPLAILGQTLVQLPTIEGEEKPEPILRSAFYPFCEYSPEWQALRQGHLHKAQLSFIDLSWSEQVALEVAKLEEETRASSEPSLQSNNLQAERYLAHSRYIQRMAQKLFCRDHDDLWEHLFELRTLGQLKDWQAFFQDTFAWCAMARLDYEPQVLDAEGSSQREAHMLICIQQIKQQHKDARILVVTGGFHTLALVEQLWQKNTLTCASKSQLSTFEKQQRTAQNDQAWLIRYSFDRLDALNGYASGMPSPQFYQERWQAMLKQEAEQPNSCTQSMREQNSLQFLSKIAQQLRHEHFDDAPNFTALRSAYEQAIGLASLRNHQGPSRYDLLDGLQTGFLKGSIDTTQAQLWSKIRQSFTGFALGRIPKSSATPPLVNEVYQKAQKFRFKLEDTLSKNSQLDIYRKDSHRERSRFLHLLAFINTGFAQKIDGPDFVNGHRLDILFEEWQYAWTPSVEARLIELSEQGTQLEQVALKQLYAQEQALEQQGFGRSSAQAVHLLVQAALMGLNNRVTQLASKLAVYIEQDAKLDSLVNCGHRLLYLWRGREFLGLANQTALPLLLEAIQPQTLFYLDQIIPAESDQQEQALSCLLSLRELVKLMPEPLSTLAHQQAFYQQLARLRPQMQTTTLISGAVDAMRFIDGYLTEQELEQALHATFSLGADNDLAIAYFIGVMRTAPELIVQTSLLLNVLDELLMDWDQERFISLLPDLRFAFSQLTPKQNAVLAERIAKKYALNEQQIATTFSSFTQQDMLEGAALDHQLNQYLQRNHLTQWFAGEQS